MPVRISERAYEHRGKWRYRITEGPGLYSWAPAGRTEADAREAAEGLAEGLQEQVDQTVGGLIELYLAYLRAMDRRESTIKGVRVKLVQMLEPWTGRDPRSITAKQAEQRYLQVAATCAAATHHEALSKTRSLWAWAVRREHVRANPWQGVELIGKPRRGKPQLRIDECRRLRDTCLAILDDGAVAVLVLLLMGLRASEVVSRVVRDLDDGGRKLIIPDAKTKAGKRPAEIPQELQAPLRARAAGQPPDALLFQGASGRRVSRWWLQDQVAKYCKLAGVPLVPPHGLRGSLASLLYSADAAPQLVAAVLGHASPGVTEAHYADRAAVKGAEIRRRLGVLDGKR